MILEAIMLFYQNNKMMKLRHLAESIILKKSINCNDNLDAAKIEHIVMNVSCQFDLFLT